MNIIRIKPYSLTPYTDSLEVILGTSKNLTSFLKTPENRQLFSQLKKQGFNDPDVFEGLAISGLDGKHMIMFRTSDKRPNFLRLEAFNHEMIHIWVEMYKRAGTGFNPEDSEPSAYHFGYHTHKIALKLKQKGVLLG